MAKMNVSQSWEQYKIEILDAVGAPPLQINECQQAFYAGAMVAMMAVLEIGETGMTENEGIARLEKLKNELIAYAERLNLKSKSPHG